MEVFMLSLHHQLYSTWRSEYRPIVYSTFLYLLFLTFPIFMTSAYSPAQDEDRNRFAAEMASAEARQLSTQSTPESLRKAIKKFEEALSLRRALGDRREEAATLNSIGTVYATLGEIQKAYDYYNQALEIRRAVADREGEAESLTRIGQTYYVRGEFQKALAYYNQALMLFQSIKDRRSEAALLNNIGLIYYSFGETQKALDYYNQALPLRRMVADRQGEATTFNNIGLLYSSLGEKQKALDYYNKALELRQALGDRRGEAITLYSIGMIHYDMGEPSRALDYYNKALPLSRAVSDRQGEAFTLNIIGQAYGELGENQKALDYYNQALALRRELGNRTGQAHTLNNIGRLYNKLGEKQKALDFLNEALPISRTIGEKTTEAATLYNIAQVEYSLGNLSEAHAKLNAALNIIESLRVKVNIPELRGSFFASVQDYYEFNIDLLMQLHKQRPAEGFDALGLQASERARARSLLEILAEARADIRQGADPQLFERERTLQQQLDTKAKYQLLLLNGKHTKEQAEAIDKELRELTTSLQEVQAQIRKTSPHYAALTQPEPLSLKEIQQQALDPDTLLLEYSLGKERSYLWLVSQNSISSYELPKRGDIEVVARRVYSLFSGGNQKALSRTGRQRGARSEVTQPQPGPQDVALELSRMIIGPVASQLGSKRLLVISDGILQFLPFGALPIPEGGKEGRTNKSAPYSVPLIVEHEIVSVPSASTLAVLRQERLGRKPAAKFVAVIADPVFDKDDERVKAILSKIEKKGSEPPASPPRSLGYEVERSIRESGIGDDQLYIPRLPSTRQEAERILALVPAGESKRVLDFNANYAAATSDELSQYRIVHFATHGLIDSIHPELSGLMLSMVNEQGEAQNGFLRAHEIFNLNLLAELIVLSACQTGLGKQVKGEGLVGLTRGFMYAGATRVVVSLWNVNDRATAELMARFYEKMLKEKMPPAGALRAAQVEMWREARWKAPYFWAAFQLQGEWK
jgi:CHAT domain-containing protein/Tfp pilus assembly protein PilF